MWHINEDLKSLFSRGNDHLGPVDGLRSISCILIVSVHLVSLLNCFISPYPHADWFDYLKSSSFRLIAILTLFLETFFVISGFLLTRKFTYQWDRIKNKRDFFKQYPVYVLKRACRYWPGLLLASLVMFVLGETNGNYVSTWLFFQNFVSIYSWSATMGPLWSVSLDMQVHIILPIILYSVYTYRKSIDVLYSLYILVILSIVYVLVAFDPITMNVIPVMMRYTSISLTAPEHVTQWINTKYNLSFPSVILHPNPLRIFLEQIYLPLFSRYGSFIIGAILALKLANAKCNGYTRIEAFKKYIYFGLVWFYMLILMMPPPIQDDGQVSVDVWVLTIFTVCARPLFAMCQAYILFTALCPVSHPYHSIWLRTILSLRIWSPIAKLSYLIYVVHYRIAFELVMNAKLGRPNRFSIDRLTLPYVVIVFIICLPITTLWHILVEKPFERYIDRILTRKVHQN